MSNLITIKEQNGKQAVSARDLYIGLGLDKSQWARWYQTNIIENDFFNENEHWIGVRHDVENSQCGRPTYDFAISIEFAKHIAMMARTEKSHEYRNYFLECEHKAKNPLLGASKELQAIFMIDRVQQEQDKRITKLENTMTIDYAQQEELRELGNRVVIEHLGGKSSLAYKMIGNKAFAELWRDYKRHMQVNSYKNTAVVDFEKGKEFVKLWQPNKELRLMIIGANTGERQEDIA